MQVYLLDDALDLWAAVLVQTPAPASAELIGVSPNILPILELGSDSLRKGLEIMESYILLAPTEMLQDNMRIRILEHFTALLSVVKPNACGMITHLMEVLIRAAESLGGERAIEVVGSGLVNSGFLTKVLDGLMENWEARQTTGPNKKYPPLDGVAETDYFSVLARIALASPPVFTSKLQQTLSERGEGGMDRVLDEWFSHFGNIGNPTQRKLNCLALTRLLDTGEKWILSRMQDLMTVWTDVIAELQEGADQGE